MVEKLKNNSLEIKKNLMINNMSKNIALNVGRLKKQQQKTQNETVLTLMKDIGNLYEQRKIPQFQTAENIYTKLLNAKTQKQKTRVHGHPSPKKTLN
mgnify:CR=1 FL=1